MFKTELRNGMGVIVSEGQIAYAITSYLRAEGILSFVKIDGCYCPQCAKPIIVGSDGIGDCPTCGASFSLRTSPFVYRDLSEQERFLSSVTMYRGERKETVTLDEFFRDLPGILAGVTYLFVSCVVAYCPECGNIARVEKREHGKSLYICDAGCGNEYIVEKALPF